MMRRNKTAELMRDKSCQEGLARIIPRGVELGIIQPEATPYFYQMCSHNYEAFEALDRWIEAHKPIIQFKSCAEASFFLTYLISPKAKALAVSKMRFIGKELRDDPL